MKNETAAVVMGIVIVLAFLAGLGLSTVLLRSTGTAETTNSTALSTSCEFTAEGWVLLQVLNSTSGKPIVSAPIQGYSVVPPCPPYPQTTVALNTTYTNATGFATFGGTLDEYRLYLHSFGNYFVDVPIQPERTTCVTLSIPSGQTEIKYSETFQFSC